ncbi:MAG: tRNA uridine-5-carboxymethylaminomethyl(34) synthesis GTPase MnmE [Chitinophagaceae bacterium]|nr:tRNA uridine-5-carboxymethylaminomethyl(34) synthesis GTPase MnmE [Chitinophagaceae bacterium]
MAAFFSNWNDTIVALATPPGIGAIGIIRLSGGDSISIVNSLFASKDLQQQPSHTIHVGTLKYKGVKLDEAVVSLFRAPASYTGENIAEISCHGSPYILQQVINACIESGARMAHPGEFTQRAFLNGKMDLAQAEAVADLIAAHSFAAQQTALKQLRGGFSSDLKYLRGKLIEFAALIELELDFSQEDVEFADRSQLAGLIAELNEAVTHLLSSFRLGNVIKNGVSVAIIGSPNVGKSTLLNALLNEDRAIVSDIAGTTRDTIEESLNIHGILFRIIDTAGIREHTDDAIEQIGVGRSYEKMKQADIIIGLFDAVKDDVQEVLEKKKLFDAEQLQYLLVINKTDVLGEETARQKFSGLDHPLLFIAAKQKEQVRALTQNLYETVVSGTINTENTIITNTRHYNALQKIAGCLNDIKAGMDSNSPGDLLALDIRRCLYYLGEITGQVEMDRDILGTIFGKFCIGK